MKTHENRMPVHDLCPPVQEAVVRQQPVGNLLAFQLANGRHAIQSQSIQLQGIAQPSIYQQVAERGGSVHQLHAYQQIANHSPQVQQVAQLKEIADSRPNSLQSIIQRKENNTGLPDQLKSGVERLSGFAMDDVRVHYNSAKPAQLNAHAYAQGNEIHLASGQERHLPHETWHVVQQKQGRVRPTLQLKGAHINDDNALEREADAKATQLKSVSPTAEQEALAQAPVAQPVVQRIIYLREEDGHISYPLPPSTKTALELLRGKARAGEKRLMDTIADDLSDDVVRVVDRAAMAAWIQNNADQEEIEALPYEPNVNPAEFPPGVSGYLRDKAGYMLVDSGRIEVQDGDAVHHIERGWLAEALRVKNLARKKHDAYKKDTTNRISAGLTIIYTDAAGAVQQWQGIIPGQWSSGDVAEHSQSSGKSGSMKMAEAEDPDLGSSSKHAMLSSSAHSHEEEEEEEDFGKQLPVPKKSSQVVKKSSQGVAPKHAALAAAGPSAYDQFLHQQPHLAHFGRRNSLSEAVDNAAANVANVSADALYHSENAFAFQMQRDPTPLQLLLQQFLADIAPVEVLSVTLDVDSHPNTMCGNMCRGSIDSVRRLLDVQARAILHAVLAANYMTHSRVYAEVAFGMSDIKANSLRQHRKNLNQETIDLAAVAAAGPLPSGYNFEVFWEKIKAGKAAKGGGAMGPFVSGGVNYQLRNPLIPGDGNCFFAAVVREMGNVETHQALRTRLANHMHDEAIRVDRAWAEDEHIHAMATLLGRCIVMHVLGFNGAEITLQFYGNAAHVALHLANVNFDHFENIEPAAAVAVAAAAEEEEEREEEHKQKVKRSYSGSESEHEEEENAQAYMGAQSMFPEEDADRRSSRSAKRGRKGDGKRR